MVIKDKIVCFVEVCVLSSRLLTDTIIVDIKLFFPNYFPGAPDSFFNSLSMIQQVIPMDLIPSFLIHIVSFPLSDVVITPTSLPLIELL